MIGVDMLARVRTGLDDRASDYSDAELYAVMNTIWRYHLPNRIDPGMLRQWNVIVTSAGKSAYDTESPTDVAWPGALLRLEKLWFNVVLQALDIYTDRHDFDLNAPPGSSVLWQNRVLQFKIVPFDVTPAITVQGTYRNDTFGTAGIANDEWALAVTRGAVLDLAIQEGWSEIAAEYATYYEGSIKTLRGLRYTEPRQMAQRPDF